MKSWVAFFCPLFCLKSVWMYKQFYCIFDTISLKVDRKRNILETLEHVQLCVDFIWFLFDLSQKYVQCENKFDWAPDFIDLLACVYSDHFAIGYEHLVISFHKVNC